MKKAKREPLSAARYLLLVFLVVVIVFVMYHASRAPVFPNLCPIDGQVAEWHKRQGQRDCEYSHFSMVEKATHTWVARCP